METYFSTIVLLVIVSVFSTQVLVAVPVLMCTLDSVSVVEKVRCGSAYMYLQDHFNTIQSVPNSAILTSMIHVQMYLLVTLMMW